ncbi:MAG: 4-hydroxythreonine-4-phosphate dehydrogenase PdxA [Desulfobulbaceae bacterium]|nr:4-hydroxythreonine-4-phosphate dehydrogenase PdxA [Desulfobulbaceae bacterium]
MSYVGITMGCPVGIGPEIILKFIADFQGGGRFWPMVIGDVEILRQCAKTFGITVDIKDWHPGARWSPGMVLVRQPTYENGMMLSLSELSWGQPSRRTGLVMAACIEEAVRLVQEGDLAAMVTCPITKAALQGAGYAYPGHTEMLADLCRSSEYAMMMAGPSLRVTLVTIHQGLAQVAASLNPERILRLIEITGRSLQIDFGFPNPRIAVAGFNPHAGEGGIFGDEERRVIAPALERARALGWQVAGPFPPDTVFHKAVHGHYDAVICMYHDQGLIPFKLLHFEDGVNVTIGLPIVRTSVDHGTAYDIAGQGTAKPTSLNAAFAMAALIVENRARHTGQR